MFAIVALLVGATIASRVPLEPNQSLRVPSGWTSHGPAADTDTVTLLFAIKHENLEQLDKIFWAVSTPTDEAYGQHLTMEQIDAIVGPSSGRVAAVEAWLNENDASCEATASKSFLRCQLTVAAANQMLDVQLERFYHKDSHTRVLRALSAYTVPSEVAVHLDFVGNVHRFPARESLLKSNVGNVTVGVTPDVLRKRYSVDDVVGGLAAGNAQAIAQFLGQYFHQTDLAEFFKTFGSGFVHLAEVSKYIGPDTGVDGTEAALDTEYIMSLGANITTWFWSTGGTVNGQEPFLTWITDVANTTNAPWVHSVSYGDIESSLDLTFMERINQEFQILGTRGISIMFASGDSGAGCNTKLHAFVPNFPASSPYVTAVGASVLTEFNLNEEAAAFSGGGFSNVFAQPPYQSSAVANFLQTSKNLPPSSFYNATSRAYPDVSAAGENFWVVVNLVPLPGVAGTSCASPTFSGIITLLNEKRILNGQSTLGFLNPFLYTHSSSLFDVTVGCNLGCPKTNNTGFCAQAGWDPVSGLGTPNYVKLALQV